MGLKFGKEFKEPWPVSHSEFTDFGRKLLNKCKDIQKPQPLSLEEINRNSTIFPIKFPIDTCRVVSQPKERWGVIQQQAASAYPVVHERVVWFMLSFLEHKTQHGSLIEKEIYTGMSLPELVQRLINKRCVEFIGTQDDHLLTTGETGWHIFETIGTEEERPPLILKNCISYDEMKLSAFLSISSHSEFINDGNRHNFGRIEQDKKKIEPSGVVIGLIAPRLYDRIKLMEHQDLIINIAQNIPENGYGANIPSRFPYMENPPLDKFDYRKMWNNFYDEKNLAFTDVTDSKRFGPCFYSGDTLDHVVLKKRYTISFDTLLLESEARAAACGKRAYVHVVGIGLGVWQAAKQQEEIFLTTFRDRLKVLLPKLTHVSFVHFSWFMLNRVGDLKDGCFFKCVNHPEGGIRIFISRRNPAGKLKNPEFDNCLIIQSYSWNSNAQPGNEFWHGSLGSSGGSAAACSTLITELHNGHINKTMVSGDNLHVASPEFGVVHIAEYAKLKLK